MVTVIEVKHNEHRMHIQSLMVDPDYFRRRIASSLISFVLALYDHSTFTVETGRDNPPARTLYESFGFVLKKNLHFRREYCQSPVQNGKITEPIRSTVAKYMSHIVPPLFDFATETLRPSPSSNPRPKPVRYQSPWSFSFAHLRHEQKETAPALDA